MTEESIRQSGLLANGLYERQGLSLPRSWLPFAGKNFDNTCRPLITGGMLTALGADFLFRLRKLFKETHLHLPTVFDGDHPPARSGNFPAEHITE